MCVMIVLLISVCLVFVSVMSVLCLLVGFGWCLIYFVFCS